MVYLILIVEIRSILGTQMNISALIELLGDKVKTNAVTLTAYSTDAGTAQKLKLL